jgi:assimilatory nitrate reductase catalytic subunit
MANAQGVQTLTAFMLAGDTRSADWMQNLLQTQQPAHMFGRQLLRPSLQAPQPLAAASPQVCSCLNVNEDSIMTHLRSLQGPAEELLERLQNDLQCGTRCGSCVPQLRSCIRQSQAVTA